MTALRLESISAIRGHGRRAASVLRDVSLSIEPGQVVMLEGPSGSGKTTLLAVAGGLLTPAQGGVWLDGVDLWAASPRAQRLVRSRKVGFVFQHSNLLPGLSVRDNVLLMAGIAGLDRKAAAQTCHDLLQALEIDRLWDRFPHELSGGEEQRAAVARALVHQPAVVLADEPTGSLDSVTGAEVAALLAQLGSSRGTAVLIATHDQRLRAIATRRICLCDGALSELPHGATE